mmetsp:Transcript_1595/g.2197  ORF Transcript_1595/g.2197 Transcript_1595/m.2197 type:complete len:321 (-) Transcript_1595:416-1378(-)
MSFEDHVPNSIRGIFILELVVDALDLFHVLGVQVVHGLGVPLLLVFRGIFCGPHQLLPHGQGLTHHRNNGVAVRQEPKLVLQESPPDENREGVPHSLLQHLLNPAKHTLPTADGLAILAAAHSYSSPEEVIFPKRDHRHQRSASLQGHTNKALALLDGQVQSAWAGVQCLLGAPHNDHGHLAGGGGHLHQGRPADVLGPAVEQQLAEQGDPKALPEGEQVGLQSGEEPRKPSAVSAEVAPGAQAEDAVGVVPEDVRGVGRQVRGLHQGHGEELAAQLAVQLVEPVPLLDLPPSPGRGLIEEGDACQVHHDQPPGPPGGQQ